MTICQRCSKDVENIRTLYMGCGYDMSELEIPFKTKLVGATFHTLEVCKYCRFEWMNIIKLWWTMESYENNDINSGLFIRRYGALIEVSEEEFRQIYSGKEPVRVKK